MRNERHKLSDKLVNKLKSQPESGMGYQVVTVRLKSGQEFPNVLILNGNELGGIYGQSCVPFEVNDIAEVDVTHLQKPSDFDPKKWFYVNK